MNRYESFTMQKIIFHYPGPFYDVLDTGEKIRPQKMLEAFKGLGYDVTEIVGTYQERKCLFSKIKNNIDDYQFIYSENRTLPLRLSGKRHLPVLFNNCDFELFRIAHNKKIPIAVFYRDIYWDYSTFSKEIGYLKHLFSIYFYKEELKLYANFADVIFTPSKRFIKRISRRQQAAYQPLPPGCTLLDAHSKTRTAQTINAVYVGSTKPPIYDISNLLANIADFDKNQLTLTVFTRESDFQETSSFYEYPDNANVQHLTGVELQKSLQNFNISIIYFKPSEYRKLCMPLKLMEAIGAGLPIISFGDNAVSDFVKENDIGWVVDEESKDNIFEYLAQHPEEIAEKRDNVLKIHKEHTWEKRAEKVAMSLCSKSSSTNYAN